jgi:hypothetical protein
MVFWLKGQGESGFGHEWYFGYMGIPFSPGCAATKVAADKKKQPPKVATKKFFAATFLYIIGFHCIEDITKSYAD